jgi:hypothetical protein
MAFGSQLWLLSHTLYLAYAPNFLLYLLLAKNDSYSYIPISPIRALRVTYAGICWLHEAWRLGFPYLALDWLP